MEGREGIIAWNRERVTPQVCRVSSVNECDGRGRMRRRRRRRRGFDSNSFQEVVCKQFFSYMEVRRACSHCMLGRKL